MSEMKQDAMSFGSRLKHAWNAFTGKDQEMLRQKELGMSYYSRPDRVHFRYGNEKTILSSIYTRIGIDVSGVPIRHVYLDEDDCFERYAKSGLNYCLTTEANIDQTARAFMQDLVMSMLDEGCVAVVPIDTTYNPSQGSYDILTMRTASIVEWHPRHIKARVYNDRTGQKEDLLLSKEQVAIIENPLYAVMNEPISTLKRLIHKLNLLDSMDEHSAGGKLDLIIQLPYPVKTELRRQEAEKRRRDIETQLTNNRFGIAYTDGTEKIIQLNRVVENKLIDHIEYLTSMLYSQLGMTKEVFEGTADERVMINYISRTVEPIVSAIADEMHRKFLTKTARSQRQKVMYFNDLFRLSTVDSLTSNGIQLVTGEVMTKNELRQRMGYKPIKDQGADQLMNPNINPGGGVPTDASGEDGGQDYSEEYAPQGGGTTLADMKVSDIP